MSEIVNIQAVCVGAVFCPCGGMMVGDRDGGLLMTNPPKVKICCPFCGNYDYHLAPYNVEIQFRKES